MNLAFNFVGYQYDLNLGLLKPTPDRWEALNSKIRTLLRQDSCMVRQVIPIMGLLSTTEQQVPSGRLHMWPIQWLLKANWHIAESLEKPILIPKSLHKHLQWWLQEENVLVGQPLHPVQHARHIFTDVSHVWWDTHLGDFTAKGL